MGDLRDRLRVALVSDVKAPILWLTAVFALVSVGLGAGLAVAVGVGDVALAAGIVAALAGVVGGLVPPTWTRQVAVPTALAVAVAALTAGLPRAGSMAGLLLLPLAVPLLIFGAANALLLEAAVSLVLTAGAPFVAGAAIRAART